MATAIYKEKKDKTGLVIGILVVVILVLVGVILYTMVLQPKFTAYVVDKQIEAQQITIANIIQLVERQGYVDLTDQEGKVLMRLTPLK